MLSIKNYTKMYSGDKKACDNVNINVESGDIFGFIGHNGAGKSTTIRLFCADLFLACSRAFAIIIPVKKYKRICLKVIALKVS